MLIFVTHWILGVLGFTVLSQQYLRNISNKRYIEYIKISSITLRTIKILNTIAVP